MFEFNYITPEKAEEIDAHNDGSKAHYYRMLASDSRQCANCENPAWKLSATGLCFACVTGTTDASDDYELVDH